MPPPAPSNHACVTGAGFARAFVPRAPLLLDDFDNDGLVDKVRGLPNASRLLEWERRRGPMPLVRLSYSEGMTAPPRRQITSGSTKLNRWN